ncbi:MAG: DUF3237 domain-containing protein [Lachnospiraceae bacterium]|nr:DUF3237 domain-containing protein [Lachnospiraceae bacterium]
MRHLFTISVAVDQPIVVGQDQKNGRRQLIPIKSGNVDGFDMDGKPFIGKVLPGGVDCQVIRPDGKCELSARYGVELNDGRRFFIQNDGIRTVKDEFVQAVLRGEFVDPNLYYFATTPHFETYDESIRWLENYIFVCKAVRKATEVDLQYYVIEK